MGLYPAQGGGKVLKAIPASAFSRGDILVYNSSSSLSRMPDLFPSTIDIAGVALNDSSASIKNEVLYHVPDFDTIYFSDCTPGSTFTRGANVNYNYNAATKGYVANTSAGTVVAVCERGVVEVEGQSVQSRILVRLITNAGGVVHS